MARSSYGPRRATTWAAEQNPGPTPRIVRLGRPANDNFRRFGPTMRALAAGLVAALAVLAALNWRLI